MTTEAITSELQTIILHAAIVDDAFDRPNFDVAQERITTFWAELEENDLISEVENTVGELKTIDDLTQEKLGTLWDNKKDFGERTKSLFNSLFKEYQDFVKADRICNCLTEAGISVAKHQTSCEVGDIGSPEFILVDYLLDGVTDTKAVEKVEELLSHYVEKREETGCTMPIIILMSSRSDIKAKAADFRQKTGMIGGIFYVLSKDELTEVDYVAARFRAWGCNLTERAELQSFVSNLSSAFKSKSEILSNHLLSLSFEDYVNLQKLLLQHDGQPLGSYFLTLFTELFDSLLRNETTIVQSKKPVDKHFFQDTSFYFNDPSETFKELLQGYTYYKTAPYCPETQDDPDKCQLKLGDLFISGLKVAIISNAECDLTFNNDSRPQQKDLPILFVPGELTKFDGKLLPSPLNFIEIDEVQYNLKIDINSIFSVPYKDVASWMNEYHYSRRFRLKNKLAYSMQKDCSKRLFRIGTLIAPPVHQKVKITILAQSIEDHKKYTQINDNTHECVLYAKKDSKKSLYVLNARLEVFTAIEKLLLGYFSRTISELESLKEKADETSRKRITKRVNALNCALKNLKSSPHEMFKQDLSDKGLELSKYCISILNNKDYEPGKDYQPIILNIEAND